MDGSIVKLIFNCISTGSGWSDLKKKVAESVKDMTQLSGAMRAVGTYAGTMGGMIGRALGAFALGNVWGIATEGIHYLIEKFGIFKDRSEEAKKKIDELRAANEKFHATIVEGTNKSISRINEETKKREYQLDVTRRMLKAELELSRAKSIQRGDVSGQLSAEKQLSNFDAATSLEKAMLAEKSARSSLSMAENGKDGAKKAVADAEKELEKAKANLKEKSKPVLMTPKVGGPGAFEMMVNQDTTNEKAAVEAARERLKMAEETLAKARETVRTERERWFEARAGVKVLEKEQKAADERAKAEKIAAGKKQDAEDQAAYRSHMQKMAVANADAGWNERYGKADDKGKIEMLKGLEDHERAKMEAAEKEYADELALDVKYRSKERIESAKRRAEEAQSAMIATRSKRLELEANVLKENEKKALKASADALKDKAKRIRKDEDETNRKLAETQRKLDEARSRVAATIDVLGNAAGMDQAGEERARRQKDITDRRFNERMTKLISSGKIEKDANGNWKANGRMSNFDRAVVDRLNASEAVKRQEAALKRQETHLRNMSKELSKIADYLKATTEL